MTFQVRSEVRPASAGYDGTVILLEDNATPDRAEVWPAAGFNCCAWRGGFAGRAVDVLYRAEDFFQDVRPTRGGVPVLFPFPNRIRDGRFTWAGKEYQLPANDSAGRNAIHGFACRRPWRVVDRGADDTAAWVTGEFWAGRDAPDVLPLWPADHRIRVTYRLLAGRLRVEAVVDNPNRVPLPFGLGYHPYFRVPLGGGGAAEGERVQARAGEFWELVDNLPTGTRLPVDAPRDLRQPRPVAGLTLDDVLTGLEVAGRGGNGLFDRGGVSAGGLGVRVRTSAAFRELVAFTPPHRQAVCLEPYTCTTDAVNLQARGIEAGWMALGPGERWSGVVEFALVEG